MTFFSNIKSKVAELFSSEMPFFAFKIYSSAINEFPWPNRYIDFLIHVIDSSTVRDIKVDVHFSYQKTNRERHMKKPVFERTVIVILKGKSYDVLEAHFKGLKDTLGFHFHPSNLIAMTLPSGPSLITAPLNVKNVEAIYSTNPIEFLAEIKEKTFYVRSFCSMAGHKDFKEWELNYLSVMVAGDLADPHYISEPCVKFLAKQGTNKKSLSNNALIPVDGLRQALEEEYQLHAIPSGMSHIFSGINEQYSEFINLDKISACNNVGIVLNTDNPVEFLKIQANIEHNIFRHSPGYVEFLLETESNNKNYYKLSELACRVHSTHGHDYPKFLNNVLCYLSKGPLDFFNRSIIERLVFSVELTTLVECLEYCLAHEQVISKKTLTKYLPYSYRELLDYLSDDYEVSCKTVNQLIQQPFLTLTDIFDKHSKDGVCVSVEAGQTQVLDFMLQHLVEMDSPKYKGRNFYIYIPVSLFYGLGETTVRCFRRFGISFIVYGRYADWLRPEGEFSNALDNFGTFFVGCDVFKENHVDNSYFRFFSVEPNIGEKISFLGPNHYYMVSRENSFIKKCIIKM